MAEGLGAWKERLREKLAAGWIQTKWAASQPVYAVVSSAALWPVLEAISHGDPAKLFPALMGVTSAVATNLVANQLQQWKDDPGVTPDIVADWIHRQSMATPAVLEEINLINEKLDAITEARQNAGEERWAQLAFALTVELRMLRSLPRFEASISRVGAATGGMAFGVVQNTGTFAPHITVNMIGDRYEGPPARTPDDSLRIYLSVLAGSHARVSLRGLDIGAGDASAEQPQLGLGEVYVNLETTTRVPGEEPPPGLSPAQFDPERLRLLRALEAVAGADRLVVLGDPGSGKSTLLNHLALCLASHALEPGAGWLGRLPDWPERLGGLVPIVVVLRDFGQAVRETTHDIGARHLWDFISRRLADQRLEFAEPVLHKALEDGSAIVLLDGMDEIPSEVARERVHEAVMAFQSRYRRSRHVVTCRTLSYQEPAWKLAEWPVVALAPLDAERIDRFVDRWHRDLVRLNVVRTTDAEDLAVKLKRAVRRPDLWTLASNPLLLTVMALVHTNGGELPEARAQLYERAVETLLWRWDQLRAGKDEMPRIRELLAAAGCQPLDLQHKLAALAFGAHESGGADRLADIAEGDLWRQLAPLHPQSDRDWALNVVEAIKLRAGLLLERAPGVYAFPHRTFQEYLAGAYLSNLPSFPAEASRRLNDGGYWHNVVLLAVGRLVYVAGNVSLALALVGELCSADPKDDPISWRKAWVAGESLVEIGVRRAGELEHGRELLPRVRARLRALVEDGHLSASERVAAGDALGKLGDPRFRDDAWGLPDDGLLGFVEIPAGPFVFGSDPAQSGRFGVFDEHRVDLPAYYIGRYPVTVAQFRAFVETGYRPGDPDCLNGLPNHPVNKASWYEALRYCDWLTDQLRGSDRTPPALAALLHGHAADGRKWRVTLPSEAEWEKAARGPAPSRRTYPWGDAPDPEATNCDDTGIRRTSPVGCFPRGRSIPYGVDDLSGNVLEWTRSQRALIRSRFNPSDPYEPGDILENLKASEDSARVLRGGSFAHPSGSVRCGSGFPVNPFDRYINIGFRMALSPFVFEV